MSYFTEDQLQEPETDNKGILVFAGYVTLMPSSDWMPFAWEMHPIKMSLKRKCFKDEVPGEKTRVAEFAIRSCPENETNVTQITALA